MSAPALIGVHPCMTAAYGATPKASLWYLPHVGPSISHEEAVMQYDRQVLIIIHVPKYSGSDGR